MKHVTAQRFAMRFGIGPTVLLAVLLAGSASAKDVYLVAKECDKVLPALDGAGTVAVRIWGYALDPDVDMNGVGDCYASGASGASPGCAAASPTVPGPRITLAPTDNVLRVYLSNLLPEPVSVIVAGQELPFVTVPTPVWTDGSSGPRTDPDQRVRSFTAEADLGDTQVYLWDAAHGNAFAPGTYLYQTGTHPGLQAHMGLYGAATRNAPPAGGETGMAAYRAADGSPIVFEQEALLLYSELDRELHDAAAAGDLTAAVAQPLNYHPDWFLINGEPFDPADPSSQQVTGLASGRPVLLRLLNAGLEEHVPTLQQGYFRVIAEDGQPYPFAGTQYSADLPPGKTKDAILTAATGGRLPIYDRRQRLTTGPNQPGGMFTTLDLSTGPGPNLLTNGDFSGGTASWTFFTNANANFTISGGSARILVNSSGTNVQLYQTGVAVEGATLYRLRFRALHTTGKSVQVRLFLHNSPNTTFGLDAIVDISMVMTEYVIEFMTTPGNKTGGRFQFWFAPWDDAGSSFFIDDVVLEKASGPGPLGPVCGNVLLDAGETCDRVELGGATCASLGFGGGCLGCRSDCSGYETRGCSGCGDGLLDAGESCDDGAANSDTAPDACRTDCTLAGCGDGVIDTGEGCDDANTAAGDGCDATCAEEPGWFCTGSPSSCDRCGDGAIQPPEVCDGATLGGATCASLGFDGGTLACQADCSVFDTSGCFGCGDGVLDAGEQCDDGAANSDTTADACRTDCTLAGCGDQVVDSVETCDDGNAGAGDGCGATCLTEAGWTCAGSPSVCWRCGDGAINPGEACDGASLGGATCANQGFTGGTLICSASCALDTSGCFRCGDGTVNPGEECDNGAANSNTTPDACRTNCTNPRCGDGATDTGEQCDDGNAVNTDACTNSCESTAPAVNELDNGDFSAGGTRWQFYTSANGSFSVVGGEASIAITTSGTNVQLYQTGVSVLGSTNYRLTFRARHTADGSVEIRLQRHTSPFTNYGLNQVVDLTSTMTTYTVDFTTTPGDKTGARFMLWLAPWDDAGSTFFFDDFVLAPLP